MRTGRRRGVRSLASCLRPFAIAALLYACASNPPVAETPIVAESPASVPAKGTDGKPAGLADEIRILVETGTPPSILRALDLIRSRELTQTEFGRAMTAASVVIMKRLYPEIPAELTEPDPPPTHAYARILRELDRGAYTPASGSASDYLELVLPFLALLSETRSERLAVAMPDLLRASTAGTRSVLDPYFRAIVAERGGHMEMALAAYGEAIDRSADCYPAVVGAARSMSALGRPAEGVTLLADLIVRFPDNLLIKRELAKAYYAAHDWSRAGPAIAEILQRDAKDSLFLLMRAHVLVEQGSFTQAQPLLDVLASSYGANRLYLFLRARVQAEGYRNKDSALTYLRSLLRSDPRDAEAAAYAARILLESARAEENEEGRALLERLLAEPVVAIAALDLAARDAVARSAWQEAEPLVLRLLAERRSSADLKYAYAMHLGLGETEKAVSVARELLERESANDEWAGLYAEALLAAGKKAEAATLLDQRLPTMTGGANRSRLFYLRSRLRTDEEAIMGDLRSSLFENPRNLEALTAMFEIYRFRKDERRAVYYLKQALALAPENPLLRRYQAEYAAALGIAP